MELKYDPLELSNFTGEKLVVSYALPPRIMKLRELGLPINQQVSARLDGTTLYIDYVYDKNVKFVFVPIWSFMRQFDGYRGIMDAVNNLFINNDIILVVPHGNKSEQYYVKSESLRVSIKVL